MKKLINTIVITAIVAFCSCSKENVQPASTNNVTQASSDSLLALKPQEARNYIDAININSLDNLVASFASNGTVVDVSRNITGSAAIRTWANKEVMGGSLRVLEINQQTNGYVRLLVHWAPRGSSGWRAWYSFTYANGRFTIADLQYA